MTNEQHTRPLRNEAATDLEHALSDIESACKLLGDEDDIGLARYLGRQIEDHHLAAAWNAYERIFGLEERDSAGPKTTPHQPVDVAGKTELRRRVAAIVAEFGAIPEASDDGIIEAERRIRALRAAGRELHRALPWDIATEDEIITPTLTAAENALVEFVEDTPAETLKAAAAKLREVLVAAQPSDTHTLRQVLDVIERAGRS